MAEGKQTPIDPGVVARVGGTLRNMVNYWFGPGAAIQPMAPDGTPPRQFDYSSGFNLYYSPRGYEPISFSQLRGLADNLTLLRLVIETRKDQLCKMDWEFRLRRDHGETKAETIKRGHKDTRIADLKEFFKTPDGRSPWETWLRMFLEDLLVIDAPALAVRKNVGGQAIALELLDGATIHPVIDETGREPFPPDVAYQQIVKGVVLANFTSDELVYLPRNRRTQKVYGFSPVEQLILLANTAIRRDLSRLNFYTDGNLPLGIARVPETWPQKQVESFQKSFNALMEDQKNRSKLIFIPDTGSPPIFPKIDMLKDEFDDYLSRLVCYCFSVSPTNLQRPMSRASAQTGSDDARQEGYLPLLVTVKNDMDAIIDRVFGYEDIEFSWQTEEEQEPLKRAQINQIYVNAGIKTVNEVRDEIGLEPLAEPTTAELAAAAVAAGAQGKPGQPGKKPPSGTNPESGQQKEAA